ncbi:unnamed protein product [Adineta steineri]|uniref:Uncharacterized protein n=1 Tax=Adineta steineri TaxID=433720 RepID=A0A814HUF1_9BILA|nr:unnamed protein product [Adineta steineri]CAF3561425.1 unnamed protein product [Adineta steineri]CAF3619870.1 unnamed protein product [Adineta steineri]CAF3643436.1 unnamed protein product [Adineta steineri]
MAAIISRTVPTSSTRRTQSQLSNNSVSLSRSFSVADSANINESSPSSLFACSNPLVTIIYSTMLLTNGSCTFIKVIHGENQQIVLNSYSSCRRLLDHMKILIGSPKEEILDLMDNEGKLKELNAHFTDYATQYLTARNTYYVLKVETDSATGDKRYTPSFNIDQIDQKICTILTNSLNSLNKSSTKIKRNVGPSKQTGAGSSTSSTSQSKTKRATNRK